MNLSPEVESRLVDFLRTSEFAMSGGVITDLDGTAVHEYQGTIAIPREVELGLMSHYERGRPIVLNTLRFPLSVIRTFGQDWYRLSNAPIPTVTLNGSLVGYLTKKSGQIVFEELQAFPLMNIEIDETLQRVKALLDDNITDLLVFYYPRDWRIGQVIWTSIPEKVSSVKDKYASASAVTAVEFEKLRDQMFAEDICMIFLWLDVPQDQLMPYQHTKQSNVITTVGIDKRSGAQALADVLQFSLSDSIGAGDTELDTFLSSVGLAVTVGNAELPFRGTKQTIKLTSSAELGALLFRSSELAHPHN